MRKTVIAASVFTALFAFTSLANADEYVDGYYRKDGTYVQPYHRSDADGNPYNNYSTKGNVNPYTGQPGTKNPYSSSYGNPYGQSQDSSPKSPYDPN